MRAGRCHSRDGSLRGLYLFAYSPDSRTYGVLFTRGTHENELVRKSAAGDRFVYRVVDGRLLLKIESWFSKLAFEYCEFGQVLPGI